MSGGLKIQNEYSLQEPSLDKETKKITKGRIRDDGDGPGDIDGIGDDNDDNNDDDSTTSTSKTYDYTVAPWLTTSSVSSSTLAEGTLTTTKEATTTVFICISYASSSTSSVLISLPTSAGLTSSSANPTPIIVANHPFHVTKAYIIVPISVATILLLSLTGYLLFRNRRNRRRNGTRKTFDCNESGGSRLPSICELDAGPATQERRTWYSRLRASFISPTMSVKESTGKENLQNCTSNVNRVPDYESYINWAHRSSSIYSVATVSDLSSGYGSQPTLPIRILGVHVEPTKFLAAQ